MAHQFGPKFGTLFGPSFGIASFGIEGIICSTRSRAKLAFGPVLGLLGLLIIIGVSTPRLARANSGNSFLETIGFTTAAGTVLGASTLPFYDQPGIHLQNLAYGAMFGAFVGLSVYVIQEISGDPHAGLFASDPSSGPGSAFGPADGSPGNAYLISESRTGFFGDAALSGFAGAPARPTRVWMPLVSLTW